MKTKEFIKTFEDMGYKIVMHYNEIAIVKSSEVIDKTIAVVSRVETCCINTKLFHICETEKQQEKMKIFKILTEYATTPIEEREKEEKYYWKLKGNWNNGHIYLNCDTENNTYQIDTNLFNICFETRFTEKEFEKICEEYGLTKEAFEKEEIEQ